MKGIDMFKSVCNIFTMKLTNAQKSYLRLAIDAYDKQSAEFMPYSEPCYHSDVPPVKYSTVLVLERLGLLEVVRDRGLDQAGNVLYVNLLVKPTSQAKDLCK